MIRIIKENTDKSGENLIIDLFDKYGVSFLKIQHAKYTDNYNDNVYYVWVNANTPNRHTLERKLDLLTNEKKLKWDSVTNSNVTPYVIWYTIELDPTYDGEDENVIMDDEGYEIHNKQEASAWLNKKFRRYGSAYWFPQDVESVLNQLIDIYGDTDFWE